MKTGVSTGVVIATSLLAVLVGLFFKKKPWLILHIPYVGAYLWIILGYNMPPFFDMTAFDSCTSPSSPTCDWLTPGSVVVAAAAKCGTNWMMTIAHELRILNATGVFDDFEDITDVVPAFEQPNYPGQTLRENVDQNGNQWNDTRYAFRAFKSHGVPRLNPSAKTPKKLPVIERPDVKFIAVVRHPHDIIVSLGHMFSSFNPDAIKILGEFTKLMTNLTMEDQVNRALSEQHSIASYLRDWWVVKDRSNVLLLHYTDILVNTRKTMKIIAEFTGLDTASFTEETWQLLEYRTGMKYMKERGDKYLYRNGFNRELRVMKPGGLIRKGGSNKDEADQVLTDAMKKRIREDAERKLTPEAIKFLYQEA